MAGISDKALKSQYAENKYRFNAGTELANKEFSDGSGLEMYETSFRGYDPQIGRFWQIDPLGELAEDWSTYVYAYNNPLLFNDPYGLAPDSAAVVPAPKPKPPICNRCSLPNPDVAKAAGKAPSNVPAPIKTENSNKDYKWYQYFNDHNPGGDILYEINKFNPLAQAVSLITTFNNGHDYYGVPQSNGQAIFGMAATIPIGRIGAALEMAEEGAMSELPILGDKLKYLFGKATGSLHNIERSTTMARQLSSIGIFNDATGNAFMRAHLGEILNNTKGIIQTNGRILRESLLVGPYGFLKVESIWEGKKLITATLIGGL